MGISKMILMILMILLIFPSIIFSEPHYWRYIDQIACWQDEYFKREYNLYPTSEGGGGIDCINSVTRWYEAPYPIDVDSARPIIVELVNRYLAAINNCKPVQPYLSERPFPITGLKLAIGFKELVDSQSQQRKQIMWVSFRRGIIWYNYDTHTRKGLETFHKETFEEACAIVAAKKSEILTDNSVKNVP